MLKAELDLMLLGLRTKAKFAVGEPVHWRGTDYRVDARYYRRSSGEILYDLKEIRHDGAFPRFQRKRNERELEIFIRDRGRLGR